MWKRVIAPTVVVSIIWIAGSTVTTYHMNTLYESQSRAVAEDVSTIESAWAMRRDVWKLQAAVLEAKHSLSAGEAELSALMATFDSNLADARRTSLTPEERRIVEKIEIKYRRYKAQAIAELATFNGERPGSNASQANALMDMAAEVTTACAELVELNEKMIDDESASNARVHRWVTIVRISFLVLGPLVGLVLGMLTARRLNRSISQISVTLEDASGKLGYKLGSVAFTDADQLPGLQRQVERIAERIRGVVGELEEARKLAIQSERLAALGELAAGVAHEIRNPLTSVKLLIQTASERSPQAAMNEKQLAVVLQEISRMEAMVQGLLDFAKPPQLRTTLQDLRQTVRRALNLIDGRCRHEGIRILEEIPDLPVWIDADPEQLHTVFVNLAINALDAMSSGGFLKVTVRTQEDRAIILFRDSGSGVSPDLIERIFEPFVTTKPRGTGLGLAISRRVITAHQGRLTAENHADGGASFTVTLPRTPASADTMPDRPISMEMLPKWIDREVPDGAEEMS